MDVYQECHNIRPVFTITLFCHVLFAFPCPICQNRHLSPVLPCPAPHSCPSVHIFARMATNGSPTRRHASPCLPPSSSRLTPLPSIEIDSCPRISDVALPSNRVAPKGHGTGTKSMPSSDADGTRYSGCFDLAGALSIAAASVPQTLSPSCSILDSHVQDLPGCLGQCSRRSRGSRGSTSQRSSNSQCEPSVSRNMQQIRPPMVTFAARAEVNDLDSEVC